MIKFNARGLERIDGEGREGGGGREGREGVRFEITIPAERIFRFLRRRVAVQYLILRSTRRVVSTNVNYHWPPTVPLHSNRPLNQRMIGVLIDCYSVIITVHWQTPVSKPPSIEKRLLGIMYNETGYWNKALHFCETFFVNHGNGNGKTCISNAKINHKNHIFFFFFLSSKLLKFIFIS